LKCEYEPVKPRKKKTALSQLSQHDQSTTFKKEYHEEHWDVQTVQNNGQDHWDVPSTYTYGTPASFTDVSQFGLENGFGVEDDVEEVVRSQSVYSAVASGSVVRSRSHYPDLAMIAPSPIASPLLEFSAPLYMEFADKRNRRALVDHFCNVLSHLVVFKEDTGNPFRQLVLPLSHASSPVLNAIFALSSAHLEYRGVVNEEKSLNFHNRALRGLATLIDQNENANREEVLGAIMLLVYYEVVGLWRQA
jgi:hypothetical protein